MEKTINLNARFNTNNYLEHLESTYVLRAEYPEAVRVGFKEDTGEYFMIDPPDGPMIAVGDEINGMKVHKISFRENVGYTITLVNDN